jgi:hypothetical protein
VYVWEWKEKAVESDLGVGCTLFTTYVRTFFGGLIVKADFGVMERCESFAPLKWSLLSPLIERRIFLTRGIPELAKCPHHGVPPARTPFLPHHKYARHYCDPACGLDNPASSE